MTDKITIERETLLPCPFCGDDGDKGRQEVTQMIEGRNKFTRITCRACGAMCPEENWNRRSALAAQPAEPVANAPVAWLDEFGNVFPLGAWVRSEVREKWKPLYTEPAANAAQPAPVAVPQDEKIRVLRDALELIATPMRPDGTWNRDRLACHQIAVEALEKTK